MFSSLKLLEQFSPDFTWGLLSKGYWQFIGIVLGPLNKMAAMPLMVKRYKKSSSLEPRKLWDWILVYNFGDSRSTKFVQMMVVDWPLTFLRKGQICTHIYLSRENVEKPFSQNVLKTNGWNWQCMIKVVKCFSYNQNFVPWGLSALAPVFYTCIKLSNF